MKHFLKPRIVISKCIEHGSCRYNGQMISSEFVEKLKSFVDFVPICPEFEIGLGVPRDPIRIVSFNGDLKLLQLKTEKDVTKDMIEFSNSFLDKLLDIDGFILKSKSPSCGIKDSKIHTVKGPQPKYPKGPGFFGKVVQEKHPNLAIEDEGRLLNSRIKQHFLTKIYSLRRFREVKKTMSKKDLVEYQSYNKLLFGAYSQKETKEIGRIVANMDKYPLEKIFQNYEAHLFTLFSKPPKCPPNINILLHGFGYISKNLNKKEKEFFLETIDKYRNGNVSLSVPTNILKSWVLRFDEKYLENQSFFEPYPDELLSVEDLNACEVKDYWE
ncbi:MAG: DUF523 and DUF1722 domain-containing protein [Candidatus Methanofastidiosum sp.]|nr:DUF523 and DUF1722 domain-containing protein [Methanofastidiosum sp.]